jgi:hypothetical protein
MPASVYEPEGKVLFIRVGPECAYWGAPYTIALDCEIKGDVAVIGGLDKTISKQDYKDVCDKIRSLGYKPAMVRVKYGLDNIHLLPGGANAE